MKKHLSTILISLIIILASVLRFNQITTLPALNADEAALGYNAYSLFETGRDEHGNALPIHFQSFNDYKPGLYVYLDMLFIKIFGLNEMAVRLPGIIAGILSVWFVWSLVKRLPINRKWLPEMSALLLAISPWHIHFSRGGWEVNVATALILAGIVCFLAASKNYKWYFVSITLLVLSLYTYHAARIVAPLLGLAMVLIYRNDFFKEKRIVLISVILGLLLIIPLARDFIGPAGISRASGVGLFADTGPFWRTNEQRGEHAVDTQIVGKLLHNKATNYGLTFLSNYTSHFNGEFLFLSGDVIQRNKVPELGQMYLVDLIFLPLGLILALKNFNKWKVILIWLIVAPIAAALTFQAPHALRAQNMVIPLVVLSAYGLLRAIEFLKKSSMPGKQFTFVFILLIFALYFWDFSRYLHQYYFHMAKTYDYSSQYGVKELVDYIGKNQDKYKEVVVTNRYDQPYILFLFYLKYPPEKFQQEHALTSRDNFGFSTVESFGKYKFIETSPWDKIRTEHPGALIAGTDKDIPKEANILDTVIFPSGRVAFKVVAN
jgi:4-amino-4-deoxy-L-arabinose transferase-like glycosyltransferase